METKKAPQIPYGISDFVRMRTENYYYVDKTMYLPLIEDTAIRGIRRRLRAIRWLCGFARPLRRCIR